VGAEAEAEAWCSICWKKMEHPISVIMKVIGGTVLIHSKRWALSQPPKSLCLRVFLREL
jgi:uncharacterized membrane protein